MTVPFERTRALLLTREMLQRLASSKDSAQVPVSLRDEAASLLRHYPTYADIELAHQAHPEIFGKRPAIPPWLGIGVGCR